MRVRRINSKISYEELLSFAFVMFFCSDIAAIIVQKLMGIIHLSAYYEYGTAVIIYVPILIICIARPKKYLKFDFLVLLSAIVIMFYLALYKHPEYSSWYSNETYGIWNNILFPLSALYSYLFIRLINDPYKIWKLFKISGFIILLFSLYQTMGAMHRGYWSSDKSYSVEFGYKVLMYSLPYIYDSIRKKNVFDIAVSAVSIIMMLAVGSRGAILFLIVFFMLISIRAVIMQKMTAKNLVKIIIVLMVCSLGVIFYKEIISSMIKLLSNFNISSRFLNSILNGTISDDNGRDKIYKYCYRLIHEKPYGWWPLGGQMKIYNRLGFQYPHSIMLEMILDYGIILGIIALVILVVQAVKLYLDVNSEWNILFIVFFSVACQLTISKTYWTCLPFWISIAIARCYYIKKRKKKRYASN